VDGDSLCEACFDDSGATECEECGNSSTSCVTVHTEGEATMACESCAEECWTECDECGEWRHDTQDWKRGCESCDECTPPLSDGAEEILANSNESFEEWRGWRRADFNYPAIDAGDERGERDEGRAARG